MLETIYDYGWPNLSVLLRVALLDKQQCFYWNILLYQLKM